MIVLRTKVIRKSDEKALERELNEFLETMDLTSDVKEIKYQFNDGWFSAMVVYYAETCV